MIETLLFDLDNTLFEYDDAFTSFIENVGRRFEFSPDDEEMELIRFKNKGGYAPRLDFFEWLVAHYGLSVTSEEFWGVMKEDFSNFIVVTDATKKMLKRFSKDYRVGILTNGSSENQRNKITRTGLNKIVSEIFISGEMESEKPDPEVFRLACEKLDTLPEKTLYIGDHWENDIVGGKNAGLKTCWIQRGELGVITDGVCDYVIRSLDDLDTILIFND